MIQRTLSRPPAFTEYHHITRAKNLVELKTENIDFQHNYISFKQSKTESMYRVELLPAVQEALEIHLSETNPSLENKPVFRRIHTPFRPLSRSAAWSIVATTRIKSSVYPFQFQMLIRILFASDFG